MLFNSNNSLLLRGQLNVAQRSCTVIPNRAVVITGTNLTDKTLLMQLGRIFTIHYLFQTLTADDFICNTRQDPNFCDKANKKDCGSHVWLCPVTRRRPVPAKPSEVSAKTNTAAEIWACNCRRVKRAGPASICSGFIIDCFQICSMLCWERCW